MQVAAVFSILLACVLTCVPGTRGQDDFDLTIIHINDFHARYEPTSVYAAACLPGQNEAGECYGGVARIATALRELSAANTNPVLINGGDNYQGTLLYSLFRWNITVEFMNRLPFDATAIGNHEFDDGVEGVVPYFKGMDSPIVAANIDDSKEPTMQGEYEKSTIVERDGRRIGIVGCIASDTASISSTGELVFLDEVAPVNAEIASLRSQGVDIIILVSHSGFDVDQRLAREIADVDVIVGSHSHTFLYTGDDPPSVETVRGTYPTVVQQTSGRTVLIVQAYAYTKYVGVLNLKFNAEGEVTSWSGNPVLMDSNVVEDAEVKAALQPWVDEANVIGSVKLGSTLVYLDNSGCYSGECNIGNFLTDGMVMEQMALTQDGKNWSNVAIALINPGGIRASMGETSDITYNDLATAQPFQNSIDTIELQGRDLKELLEQAAAMTRRTFREEDRYCMQMSGLQVVYNMTQPAGSRVVELMVRCAKCRVPQFYPVNLDEWYGIAMPSFLSNGGDAFTIIAEKGRNKVVGDTDIDVFSRYIIKESPIVSSVEARFVYVN